MKKVVSIAVPAVITVAASASVIAVAAGTVRLIVRKNRKGVK